MKEFIGSFTAWIESLKCLTLKRSTLCRLKTHFLLSRSHQPFVTNVVVIITGPPTHSVKRPVLFCSLASVVVVCNTPLRRICNVTHPGASRDGGPVVLHPVRATPCYLMACLHVKQHSPIDFGQMLFFVTRMCFKTVMYWCIALAVKPLAVCWFVQPHYHRKRHCFVVQIFGTSSQHWAKGTWR